MGMRPSRRACDLRLVEVEADDVVAEVGKADAGDQPHVAHADDAYRFLWLGQGSPILPAQEPANGP